MSFSRNLFNEIVLIDGGLGSTLVDYGLDIHSDPLWSGKVLIEQPEQLARVHRDFVRAKADVIGTGTYQVSVDNLMEHYHMSHEEAEEIIFSAVGVARNVIDEEKARCYVAASVGPYGAILHDGSEFNGWYTDKMSIEEFKNWHRPRLEILIRSQPDLIAFETIPSQKEGQALLELLREFPNSKAWLSFNCQNTKQTAHGELIEDAVNAVCQICPDQLLAVGVNCIPAENVVPLMQRIGKINCDLIAYPNAGAIWDKEKREFVGRGRAIVPFIHSYLDANVKYVGGCCHVDPDEIRTIRTTIDQYQAKL